MDTKYEFGLLGDQLVLIDEIHTPDSSRMWDQAAYDKDPLKVESHDKEYVRAWLRQNRKNGEYPTALPEDVVRETTRRYVEIYERITGEKLAVSNEDPRARLARNLHAAGLIKDGFVAIVMGSRADLEHADKMKAVIEPYGIYVDLRVCSAHKNGEDLRAAGGRVQYRHRAGRHHRHRGPLERSRRRAGGQFRAAGHQLPAVQGRRRHAAQPELLADDAVASARHDGG